MRILFALLLSSSFSTLSGAEDLEWRSVGLRQNVVLCAALFHVRSDWMVEFKMDPTASKREFDASDQLQSIYAERVPALSFRPYVSPDQGGPPTITGPLVIVPFDLGPDVYWARQKLVEHFTDSGAMKHRPPVCIEDETCSSCWNLLRQMQAQE